MSEPVSTNNTMNDYTTLFPYLFVDGAESYIDFLIKGLGGEELGRTLGPEGQIANARIRFGNTIMMLSEAQERFPVSQVTLYLYVSDANAAVEAALAAGAELVMPTANMDYGDRQGGVKDSQGNIWWLSQRLEDGNYDD